MATTQHLHYNEDDTGELRRGVETLVERLETVADEAAYEVEQLTKERDELKERVTDLEAEVEDLKRQLADFERAAEVA